MVQASNILQYYHLDFGSLLKFLELFPSCSIFVLSCFSVEVEKFDRMFLCPCEMQEIPYLRSRSEWWGVDTYIWGLVFSWKATSASTLTWRRIHTSNKYFKVQSSITTIVLASDSRLNNPTNTWTHSLCHSHVLSFWHRRTVRIVYPCLPQSGNSYSCKDIQRTVLKMGFSIPNILWVISLPFALAYRMRPECSWSPARAVTVTSWSWFHLPLFLKL